MFVARSAARVRLARVAFLVLGLAPAAGLAAWAVHRQSDVHRAAVERRWQQAVGLPLAVGRIEHPRPGVCRGRDCVLPAAEGHPAVVVPLVEVESSADEDRIRIDRFTCDLPAAAVLARLGRAWLADEVRHRRTCIIDVADFTWGTAAPPAAGPATALRIECVVRPDGRAIRVVRRGQTDDELRIVRGSDAAAAPTSTAVARACTITAACSEPVPLAVLAVASGAELPAAAACGSALVTGTLEATRAAAGWEGSARGQIVNIDLAAAAAAVGGHVTGTAAIDVTRLAWSGGRVSDGLFECVASGGSIDGRLFDRIVLALGARPGPGAGPLPPDARRGFDAAACIVGVGPHGVQVMPTTRLPAGLATWRGGVLLTPPAGPVPGDRLAWMLSAPGTRHGPAIGPGSWLISVLPEPFPQAGEPARQF